MSTDLRAAWQQRLDTDFPDGMLASWSDSTDDDPPYQVPRPVVEGMDAGAPVVMLEMAYRHVGPLAVRSLKTAHYHPVRLHVQVQLGPAPYWNKARPMVWDASLPETVVNLLRPQRDAMLKAYPP